MRKNKKAKFQPYISICQQHMPPAKQNESFTKLGKKTILK